VNADRLLVRDCSIVRRTPGDEDEYGNPVPVEVFVDTCCYAEQRRSAQPAGVGDRAVSDWLVVLPIETAVTIADAIRLDDGSELEVIGDPWPVHNPWAEAYSHIELIAREAT